ncbi:hypothetical protein FOQG_09633 [Fusarium oxysporum f. sp. raphani 54005]|uniref:Uncharacterized protein n=9 Tax=Fusarium oxysporum TaxID=5507 RepID=A0A2H3SWF4_FUSOX|nr:hypothetical protein FOXG_00579 [Fusarium oxysporum f. sp. lycopersici 4287]EGU80641.1 hypothetical protein FOXB_08864 [Fusarium oxysporum f. sp. conglutinans Fo5176]EWY93656.1 hypothetical protein FOYG_06759 [Fusarium oxysporum NRRL 32931]EWZ91493.1 hypothetical protein FOWG_07040 [Fusarium oxysporum f. sp. lycopersici MN25]EXA52747.1 hypothetical protein FOVG_00900 [Fusarium oxysporum f. sp. pisi HDV247]EXK48287.1 hypothetical protein FOMG_01296 [Fusarium oxysporum f. sp. melonis 26406]E
MSAIASYTYGNFLWLSTQALPLIVWPSFVGSLLRPGNETSTSWALLQLLAIVSANNSLALETYFGRSLGLALLALGLTVVVLSGVLPLDSSSKEAPEGAPSPYASAAVLISTLHHASSAFYCYGRYSWTGETGFLLGCVGSAVFATFGLYCVLFAGDTAMTSRYHKFDQSTSGFPFKNSQSYRAKKKAL